MTELTKAPEKVAQATAAGAETNERARPAADLEPKAVSYRRMVLVSGNGGILNYHSTTLLSPHEAVA